MPRIPENEIPGTFIFEWVRHLLVLIPYALIAFIVFAGRSPGPATALTTPQRSPHRNHHPERVRVSPPGVLWHKAVGLTASPHPDPYSPTAITLGKGISAPRGSRIQWPRPSILAKPSSADGREAASRMTAETTVCRCGKSQRRAAHTRDSHFGQQPAVARDRRTAATLLRPGRPRPPCERLTERLGIGLDPRLELNSRLVPAEPGADTDAALCAWCT